MKTNIIILSLILAFIFISMACVFTACTPNNQGSIIESTQSSSEDSTSDNNDSDGGNNDSEQEFSSVLDKVLNDEIYLNLRNQFSKNNFIIKSNDMLPIPYKFLRDHGHNVDAYLDGTLDAFASSYIYDSDKNYIYVSVKAENVSYSKYGNYYTNYVLKYPLTDQEYEEYIYLRKGYYLQAYLFIQELDNQKTPEIVNKLNIAVDSYNDMIKEFTKWDTVNVKKYNYIDIDIIDFNENEITITSRGASNSNYFINTIGKVKITPTRYTGIHNYEDNVHYLADAYRVKFNHDDEYKSSLQKITSFGDMHKSHSIYRNPYNYYDDWHPGEFYYG